MLIRVCKLLRRYAHELGITDAGIINVRESVGVSTGFKVSHRFPVSVKSSTAMCQGFVSTRSLYLLFGSFGRDPFRRSYIN